LTYVDADISGAKMEPSEKSLSSAQLGKKGSISEASRFLIFSLAGEQYAVPLLKVKEVIALTETTPVPYSPPYFKGIMNLRGQVISVIDLRAKLKMPKAEASSETAIIILDLSPLSLGIVVDSVESVLAVDAGEIQPPPEVGGGSNTNYIRGVTRKDKKLILLLDIEKTLSVEDLKALKSSQHAA
jgi:purine-binding chemotaxis protein CheW